MAMVMLKNLFEYNRNFYGLLNPALDQKVNVEITEFGKLFLPRKVKCEIRKLNNKPLREITNSSIGQPEWTLAPNGKLVKFTRCQIMNTIKTIYLIEINILPWLASLDLKYLRMIADVGFKHWIYDKKVKKYELIPRYKEMENIPNYFKMGLKRHIGKQLLFFKSIYNYRLQFKKEGTNE